MHFSLLFCSPNILFIYEFALSIKTVFGCKGILKILVDMFEKFFSLLKRVQSEDLAWKDSGTAFITSVTRLLERLLDYRSVIHGDENRDKRMSCTVNLLVGYLYFATCSIIAGNKRNELAPLSRKLRYIELSRVLSFTCGCKSRASRQWILFVCGS